MFVSARMKKVDILTLVSDEPRVTETLGEMGVLHLTRAPLENGATPVAGPETEEDEARLAELSDRANQLCRAFGVEAEEPPAEVPHSTLFQIEGDLNRVESDVREYLDERGKLEGERARVEKLLRDASALRGIHAPLEQLEELSFLHFAFGSMTRSAAERAEDELADRGIVLPYTTPYGEDRVVAISGKKGRWALETTLEEHGFRAERPLEDEAGTPAKVAELAEQRLARLIAREKAVHAALREAAEEHGPRLLEIRRRLETERRIIRARQNFAHTWATMLITGWTPAERVAELSNAVLDLTDGRAVIEVHDPRETNEEPPTLMDNHPLLRPFEMLVSTYSTPNYREVEPTPFIAIFFVLMFGVMFGDVGHSALVLIAGLVLWRKANEPLRDLGVILIFCGISGILFGFVYGSVFGLEEIGGVRLGLLPPLSNIGALLGATVVFGVGLISLGIVLNIINGVRRGDYAQASFGRFGLVGGIFYWGAVAVAARGVVLGEQVSWAIVAALVLAPLVILLLYRPVRAYVEARRGAEGATMGNVPFVVVENLVEVFETVLMYVANTLSFARLAAFALAHAGLSVAVFEVMDVARSLPGGPLWAGLVFASGTLVIVALEGLVVAIQSMRLEYYEFLGKFFRGEGRTYRPFSLKT